MVASGVFTEEPDQPIPSLLFDLKTSSSGGGILQGGVPEAIMDPVLRLLGDSNTSE